MITNFIKQALRVISYMVTTQNKEKPMDVIRRYKDKEETTEGWTYWCPGCCTHHYVNTKGSNKLGTTWLLRGSPSMPTFLPTIMVQDIRRNIICHHSIEDGRIRYHNDTTHAFRGFTMGMDYIDY